MKSMTISPGQNSRKAQLAPDLVGGLLRDWCAGAVLFDIAPRAVRAAGIDVDRGPSASVLV